MQNTMGLNQCYTLSYLINTYVVFSNTYYNLFNESNFIKK